MIVLKSTYVVPLDELESLRDQHLAWLRRHLEARRVVAAGRLDPPTGAIVLLTGVTGEEALAMFEDDPYVKGGAARYEVLAAFNPGLRVPELEGLLG